LLNKGGSRSARIEFEPLATVWAGGTRQAKSHY